MYSYISTSLPLVHPFQTSFLTTPPRDLTSLDSFENEALNWQIGLGQTPSPRGWSLLPCAQTKTHVPEHPFLQASQRIYAIQPEALLVSQSAQESVRRMIGSGLALLQGLEESKQPAKKLLTDTGRKAVLGSACLRDKIFARARKIIEAIHTGISPNDLDLTDIYSVAMILPMTDWNTAGNAFGNVMKDLAYRMAREFFSNGSFSVDAFIKNLSADQLLRDFEKQMGNTTFNKDETEEEKSTTTVVNGVMIALQLDSIDNIVPFIQALAQITEASLLQLQNRLTSDTSLTPKQRNQIEQLVVPFEFKNDRVFLLDPETLETRPLAALYLDFVRAGVSKYNTALEKDPHFLDTTSGKKRNMMWILDEAQRMRDEAIKNAEYAASHRDTMIMSVDQPKALERPEIAWRDGRLLKADPILAKIKQIVKDTDLNTPELRKYKNDLLSEKLKQKRKTASIRLFKGVSFTDLKDIAPLVAQIYLAQTGEGNFDISDNKVTSLAIMWILALKNDSRIKDPEKLSHQFAFALEMAFKEEITNKKLLALYHEIGGFVEPGRLLRAYERLQSSLEELLLDLYHFDFEQEGAEQKFKELQNLYDNILQESILLMDVIGRDLRDGETRPKELIAAAAKNTITKHYETLDANIRAGKAVPVAKDDRGYLTIGFEAKNARVLDREVSPVTRNHVIDKNMIQFRGLAFLVAREVYGINNEGTVYDVVEAYAQGDEMVAFFPKHKRDGTKVTLSEINAAYRKVMKRLFPQDNLHYNHKQEIKENGGTQRLKMFTATANIKAGDILINGANIVFASENHDPSKTLTLNHIWILEINGIKLTTPILVPTTQITTITNTQPILGPISARLVAIDLPLETSVQELDSTLEKAMDLDVDIKKQDKPTKGIWLFDSKKSTKDNPVFVRVV